MKDMKTHKGHESSSKHICYMNKVISIDNNEDKIWGV